jgi:hypothetical protein
MSDPFVITGRPAVLCNSGGKTSGYNLRRHLDANGGTLTGRGVCVFTNTGWEQPATLDFLAEQGRRWGVDIVWLEFCRRPATAGELARLEAKWQKAQDRLAWLNAEPLSYFEVRFVRRRGKRRGKGQAFLVPASPQDRRLVTLARATKYALACFHSWRKAALIGMNSYRRVNRDTASTDGRPYQELLEGLLRFREEVKGEPGVLPNGVQRICTGRLKMDVSAGYAFDRWGVGPSGYEARLGLRADEEERVTSAFGAKSHGAGVPRFPLDEAGVTKVDVAAFWAGQPFRLALKAHEGNCAGCHMKRRGALVDLIRREFFDVSWWAGWEARTGQRFRQERTYNGLALAARHERDLLPPDDYDNGITCETGYCTD